MKRLKLFKGKMWLSTFALTTVGSLVLAACGSPAKTNEEKPTDSSTATKTETKATATQKAVVDNLLTQSGFVARLNANVVHKSNELSNNVATIQKIGLIEQHTVETSKVALGKKEDVKSKENGKSAFAYLNQLDFDFNEIGKTTPWTEEVTSGFKNKFDTTKEAVEDLIAKINALPELKEDDKKTKINPLDTEAKAFTDAWKKYADATTLDLAKTEWANVETALTAFETATKTKAELLNALLKAAFKLDAAVTELGVYINTDVAKLVENNSDSSLALNNFLNTVRENVLGTTGKDLWTQESDAPKGATDEPSTALYKVVVQLADENAAFAKLKNNMKVVTFNKALSLSETKAVDLLAAQVDDAVYLDVARLNAYLINDSANAVELMAKTKDITVDSEEKSLKTVLDDFVKSTTWFKKYLITTDKHTAELSEELTKLLATKDIKEEDKKAIEEFQNAFASLETELNAFYNSFFNSEVTTSFVGLAHNLEKTAMATNEAIGLAQNFGSVLAVIASSKQMENVAAKLKTSLAKEEVTSDTDTTKKTVFDENLQWRKDWKALMAKMAVDTDFAKALDKIANHTFDNNIKNEVAKIIALPTVDGSSDNTGATSGQSSDSGNTGTGSSTGDNQPTQPVAPSEEGTTGTQSSASLQQGQQATTPAVEKVYTGTYYDTVVKGFKSLDAWFVKYNVKKADASKDLSRSLDKLINLAKKQLSPSQGSQTAQLLEHLANTYNNNGQK